MLTALDAIPAQAPPRQRGTKDVVPIDHAHLARYTMNDHDLEREILELFLETLDQTTTNLNKANDPDAFDTKGWAMAAHTLKGSARAVGAWKLAKLMENAEETNQQPDVPQPDLDQTRRDILTDLDAVAGETKTYIDALIAAAGQE